MYIPKFGSREGGGIVPLLPDGGFVYSNKLRVHSINYSVYIHTYIHMFEQID